MVDQIKKEKPHTRRRRAKAVAKQNIADTEASRRRLKNDFVVHKSVAIKINWGKNARLIRFVVSGSSTARSRSWRRSRQLPARECIFYSFFFCIWGGARVTLVLKLKLLLHSCT